jgi:hypothetical protein
MDGSPRADTIRIAVVGGHALYYDATRALLEREGFAVALDGAWSSATPASSC